MSYFDEKILCAAFKAYLLKRRATLAVQLAYDDKLSFVCEILKLIDVRDDEEILSLAIDVLTQLPSTDEKILMTSKDLIDMGAKPSSNKISSFPCELLMYYIERNNYDPTVHDIHRIMRRTTIDPAVAEWCTDMLHQKVKSATLYELVDVSIGVIPQFENVITDEIFSRGSFDLFVLLKIKRGSLSEVKDHFDAYIAKCTYVEEITTYLSIMYWYPKKIVLNHDCKIHWEIANYKRVDEKSDLDFIITKIREIMAFIQTND